MCIHSCISNNICRVVSFYTGAIIDMNPPVVTQREVQVEAPGEGAETHCCSGRVVSAVEETQTEAL